MLKGWMRKSTRCTYNRNQYKHRSHLCNVLRSTKTTTLHTLPKVSRKSHRTNMTHPHLQTRNSKEIQWPSHRNSCYNAWGYQDTIRPHSSQNKQLQENTHCSSYKTLRTQSLMTRQATSSSTTTSWSLLSTRKYGPSHLEQRYTASPPPQKPSSLFRKTTYQMTERAMRQLQELYVSFMMARKINI